MEPSRLQWAQENFVAAQQKVFITGVAGFLGSHLADTFLADGHQVVGVDNMIGGYLDNVPEGVEFHQYDCNDFAKLNEHMKGCDIVYHCAATAYEGLSVFSPHMITQNIVTASTGAISAVIANRVRRFVMCSSMARYGTNQVPFREDMTPRPQDPYGIGKWTSELMLQNLAEVHGMEWVVAVPHNIVGPRQKYDDPYRNVASIFINLMLQGRQPYIYGDGNQMRCFFLRVRRYRSAEADGVQRRMCRASHQYRPRRRVRYHQRVGGDHGPVARFSARNHLYAGAATGSAACELLGRQGAQAARL